MPIRPPRRRTQRVQAEPDAQGFARLEHACDDGVFVASRLRRGAGGQDQHACPPAAGFAVDHGDPLAQAALGQQRVRLPGGLGRSRDAPGEVDRDDVPALLDQRLPDGQEVSDRGLRGARQFRVGAQPLVEGVEALHLELALGLAGPADVEADLVDSSLVGEGPGEIVR